MKAIFSRLAYIVARHCNKGGILKLGVLYFGEWPEQQNLGRVKSSKLLAIVTKISVRDPKGIYNTRDSEPHPSLHVYFNRALPIPRTRTVTALNWTTPTVVTPCSPQPPSLHEATLVLVHRSIYINNIYMRHIINRGR